MSILKEIKQMAGERLAYRLWPEKEDSLVYTDKRALLFVRLMTLFFSLAILAAAFFISTKQDVPFPVYIFLGFFFLTFFCVFLFKAFSHKEVEFSPLEKKIVVRKKRFNSVLNETVLNFNEIKKLTLSSATRIEKNDNHGNRSRSHLELVMEFNGGRNIHFSVINDPESALQFSNKLADLVGVKLISKI